MKQVKEAVFLLIVFILEIILVKGIIVAADRFDAARHKDTIVTYSAIDISTPEAVTVKPVERKHVTLKPVEPGYIPDTEHYYITWADRLKISLDDFKLMCTTVECEVGICSYKTKYWAAKCILNRLYSDQFPNTMSEVIYQNNGSHFNVVRKPGFPGAYEVSDETEQACFEALTTDDVPRDLFYFNSIDYFSWATNFDDKDGVYFSRQ